MVNISAYRSLISELNEKNVRLVAVSKLKTPSDILAIYREGHRHFGENYVQEMVEKQQQLPADIEWHFIGHLQTNKVRYIAPFVSMIQSVDSFKLLGEIQKQAAKNNRIIDVLLQVYVGDEDTKYGMDEKETLELLEYYDAQRAHFTHVQIRGLMGMASFVNDMGMVRREFDRMRQLFQVLRAQFFIGIDTFDTLSMGMSSDYALAIGEGSNMVRIGSTIFGNR